MAKYSVKLVNKEVIEVKRSDADAVPVDTILEPTTGETIWATIEANSDEEAKEKAERVARELQTGETKRELDRSH
jgi:hypothetical protein